MKEIVSYNAGWVHPKPETALTENFCRIFLFYVVNTPCEDLSSSSKSMQHDYHWDKNVWKNDDLKNALYKCAHLSKNAATPTLEVCKDSQAMHEAFVKTTFSGNFHASRSVEKVCIFKPSKYSEFIAICYHIRNALAHGRFSIYGTTDSDRIYVMEDGIHHGEKDFDIRSRMILKEQTLLAWIKIINDGPTALSAAEANEHRNLVDDVLAEISKGNKITKSDLARTFHIKEREISVVIKELKSADRIKFDNARKSWITDTTD